MASAHPAASTATRRVREPERQAVEKSTGGGRHPMPAEATLASWMRDAFGFLRDRSQSVPVVH